MFFYVKSNLTFFPLIKIPISTICQATKDTVVGTVMFVSAGIGFIAVGFAIYLHIDLGGKRFSKAFPNQEDEKNIISERSSEIMSQTTESVADVASEVVKKA